MKIQKSLLALCCIVTMFIAGCSSSSTKTSTSNVNGVFADAPVVGLSYSCGTTTGVTGAGGAFTCPKSSTVTFTIGGVTICSAPVQAFMTPVTCAQANGNPTADASTPSVVATAQFVISVGTPAGTTPGTLTTLTITSAELQAAAGVSLDFSTATQAELLAAVNTVNQNQTLISPTDATTELTGAVATNVAGTYSGTYSGGDTGTWTVTIDNSGNVTTGSYTSTSGQGGSGAITGNLVYGTTFSGTAGSATWTGTANTSQPPTTGKGPYLFSGTWDNTADSVSGSFTN